MSETVEHFLKNISEKVFSVQFVVSIAVDGHDQPLTQIDTRLLAASSIDEARSEANRLVGHLCDSYNNGDGELVTIECLGIHRVRQLTNVYQGRWLKLAKFTFSASTRPEDLLDEPKTRTDIPRLGQ